jgi:hypothetical protein
MKGMTAKLQWLALVLPLLGCTGKIESPQLVESPQLSGTSCDPNLVQPGNSPIRRLTRGQYNDTVHDLLDDTSAPGNRFPEEEVALGFTNNADSQSVSVVLIEQYESAAIDLATTAVTGNLPALLGCDPAAQGEDACVRAFLPRFGLRAYRRPLEQAEVDRLVGFYATSKQAWDFKTAVQLTLQAMLQSPHFLYRVEIPTAEAISRPSGYEMASRLSYLFWSSMPDAALLEAAGAHQLETPEAILAQAQRLLKDPRANQPVSTFFAEWLELDKLGRAEKDATLFPQFTPTVRALLRKETELFVSDLVFNGGNVKTLLVADYSWLNKDLATYYGVRGPSTATFEKVKLSAEQRAGILTHGSVMASHAKSNQTSPVARGVFVREKLLCSSPPPPPPNIKISVPPVDPTLSTRDRFAQHRTDPACSGCHALMEPIGFGFEHYDPVGRWRETEGAIAIDDRGEVVRAGDATGTFEGARGLATRLSQSVEVEHCVVRQLFRYSSGRGESDNDLCTLAKLNQAFAQSGADFKSLLTALTQTDAFLYRTNEP